MSKHVLSPAFLYARYIMALVNGYGVSTLRLLLHDYYRKVGGRK